MLMDPRGLGKTGRAIGEDKRRLQIATVDTSRQNARGMIGAEVSSADSGCMPAKSNYWSTRGAFQCSG
jgi:hypothetical protein